MEGFVHYWIVPLARERGWKSFCEIGASTGASTDEILALPGISHTIIDPCFDEDLAAKYEGDTRVRVVKSNSLDALPKLTGPYDCILIDGDHNWYTVLNELRVIRERNLLRKGGMIFFHDVAWPYGRRDMYYQPDTIPAEFRQEYECKGIVRGQSKLSESEGFNSHLCNAVREGGPRNGVLTAIEDFVAEHPGEYRLCRLNEQYGLGAMQYRCRKLSDDLAFLRFHASVNKRNLSLHVKSLLGRV